MNQEQHETESQQLEVAITEHLISSLKKTSIPLPEESATEKDRLRKACPEAADNGTNFDAEVGLVISVLVHQLVVEGYRGQHGGPEEHVLSVALKTLSVTQDSDIESVRAELGSGLESWSGMSAA